MIKGSVTSISIIKPISNCILLVSLFVSDPISNCILVFY